MGSPKPYTFFLQASSNAQSQALKSEWERRNGTHINNTINHDATISSDVSKASCSGHGGGISQHITRLHQKAQLAQSQQLKPSSVASNNVQMMSTSLHTNLSSSSSSQMTLQPHNNIDPFSPSTNMTQQQSDLSTQQHSLQHRGIGRPQTNDQAGHSRRASDPVRVLDGKTYHVAGHHMTQSSRQRSGSYSHLNHSSSNNTNYDHGTPYNSSNHQNIDVTSNRHVRKKD